MPFMVAGLLAGGGLEGGRLLLGGLNTSMALLETTEGSKSGAMRLLGVYFHDGVRGRQDLSGNGPVLLRE